MSKERKNEDAVRGEDRTAADEERFICQTPECRTAGYAEEMYNVSGDPMGMTREKLVQMVRCKSCAAEIARNNNKRLREPGCGVYPLCRTLKKLEEIDDLRTRRADTIKWVEDLKAARGEAVRAASKQRQIEEVKNARRERIKTYARHYADSPVCGTGSVPRPAPRADGDGAHLCGLPVSCCRHDRPADRYITVMGEVVGICRLASSVFTEVFQESGGGDQRYRKLLSTGDLKQAEFFAAKWLGEDPRTDDEDER